MLTLALFSHTPHLCGAERMLLNLAIFLERSEAVHPVLLAPGEGELPAEARRHGLHDEIVPAPPWYLLPPRNMNNYRRGVQDCCETLKTMLVDLNSDAVLVNTHDQRAGHAGGRGTGPSQPALGAWRDRLAAVARQIFGIRRAARRAAAAYRHAGDRAAGLHERLLRAGHAAHAAST